jgi:hypothetical protein
MAGGGGNRDWQSAGQAICGAGNPRFALDTIVGRDEAAQRNQACADYAA